MKPLPIALLLGSTLLAPEAARAGGYTIEVIDYPGAAFTVLMGLSENGNLAGYYRLPGEAADRGLRRLNGTLEPVLAAGQPFGQALDINDDARTVGICPQPHCPSFGYQLHLGGTQSQPLFGASNWRPEGLSERIETTGYLILNGVPSGFVWDPNGLRLVNMPGAATTNVRNTNASGTMVGSFTTGAPGSVSWGAFLFDGLQFTTLHYPGLAETNATGINDAGTVVGFASDNLGAWVGWVRQPTGAYSELSIPGAQVVTPEDINNRGQIAGYFYDSAGIAHGFLATPVPEPSTTALLAAGLGVLAWRGRRPSLRIGQAVAYTARLNLGASSGFGITPFNYSQIVNSTDDGAGTANPVSLQGREQPGDAARHPLQPLPPGAVVRHRRGGGAGRGPARCGERFDGTLDGGRGGRGRRGGRGGDSTLGSYNKVRLMAAVASVSGIGGGNRSLTADHGRQCLPGRQPGWQLQRDG
jgi:hypothetical protein